MGFILYILLVYIGIIDVSIVKYLIFCWSYLVGNFFFKNVDLSIFLLFFVIKVVVFWWNLCSGDLKGIYMFDRINVFLFNLLFFNFEILYVYVIDCFSLFIIVKWFNKSLIRINDIKMKKFVYCVCCINRWKLSF